MGLTVLISLALATIAASAPTPNFINAPRDILLGSWFGVPGRNYSFDYLVIGGGQAGLTVAARLAENASLLIGVVEAGNFAYLTNGNISQVPGTDIMFAGKDHDDWHPGIDWGFITSPQEVRSLLLWPLEFGVDR